jgi:hypothetical protein
MAAGNAPIRLLRKPILKAMTQVLNYRVNATGEFMRARYQSGTGKKSSGSYALLLGRNLATSVRCHMVGVIHTLVHTAAGCNLAEFQSFFSGPALGYTERTCLASYVAHNHQIRLYSYEPIAVPDGVVRADAADIISRAEHDAFFAAAPGRVTQFSNGFRYQLLHQRGGWWVDTDVLCLSQAVPIDDIVLGFEVPQTIGNAILRFPAAHAFNAAAYAFWRDNWHAAQWGHTGPRLVTTLAIEHGLAALAAPVGELYPIAWDDPLAPFDPSRSAEVEDRIRGRPFLHLWNSSLLHMTIAGGVLAPRGSFLRRITDRYVGTESRVAPDTDFIAAILRAVQTVKADRDRQSQRGDDALGERDQARRRIAELEAELACRHGEAAVETS